MLNINKLFLKSPSGDQSVTFRFINQHGEVFNADGANESVTITITDTATRFLDLYLAAIGSQFEDPNDAVPGMNIAGLLSGNLEYAVEAFVGDSIGTAPTAPFFAFPAGIPIAIGTTPRLYDSIGRIPPASLSMQRFAANSSATVTGHFLNDRGEVTGSVINGTITTGAVRDWADIYGSAIPSDAVGVIFTPSVDCYLVSAKDDLSELSESDTITGGQKLSGGIQYQAGWTSGN